MTLPLSPREAWSVAGAVRAGAFRLITAVLLLAGCDASPDSRAGQGRERARRRRGHDRLLRLPRERAAGRALRPGPGAVGDRCGACEPARAPRARPPGAGGRTGGARAGVRRHRARVPEPRGSASRRPTSAPPTPHSSMSWTAGTSLALSPAPAQDTNAIAVTGLTAERHGLRSRQRSRHRWPAGWCSGGRRSARAPVLSPGSARMPTGCRFESFVALDSGGPLTRQALERGDIDVALLFSTDPDVVGSRGRVLADDRRLQPAENVTPLVRTEVVDRGATASSNGSTRSPPSSRRPT